MKKVVAIVATLVVCFALVGCGGMDAKTEKAYGLIEGASEGFKDPSSVRVMSGDFYTNDKGEEILCVVLSAANSYGALGNNPYEVFEDGSALNMTEYEVVMRDEITAAQTKDVLDCDAINKKLEEKWKSLK